MLRSVRFHSGYDVTLTLVNPRPDILDVSWDIETAVNGWCIFFILLWPFTKVNTRKIIEEPYFLKSK